MDVIFIENQNNDLKNQSEPEAAINSENRA